MRRILRTRYQERALGAIFERFRVGRAIRASSVRETFWGQTPISVVLGSDPGTRRARFRAELARRMAAGAHAH
jgi:hypothetical protein